MISSGCQVVQTLWTQASDPMSNMRRFIRYSALIGAVLGLGVGAMGFFYDQVSCLVQSEQMLKYAGLDRHRAYVGITNLLPQERGFLPDVSWSVDRTLPASVVPPPWFGTERNVKSKGISVPAILPFILFALIFAATFIRRRKPGHCRCGYSLEGLVSEKCPECGRESEVMA
jgi:hypothetical protein